jgi:hypothetical protein
MSAATDPAGASEQSACAERAEPENQSAPSLSVAVSETDRRIGELAVQLGRIARVARIQDAAVAQAMEDAAVALAGARTNLADAVARVERTSDAIAEGARMLHRRARTNVGLRELAAAIVALSRDLAPGAATTADTDAAATPEPLPIIESSNGN